MNQRNGWMKLTKLIIHGRRAGPQGSPMGRAWQQSWVLIDNGHVRKNHDFFHQWKVKWGKSNLLCWFWPWQICKFNDVYRPGKTDKCIVMCNKVFSKADWLVLVSHIATLLECPIDNRCMKMMSLGTARVQQGQQLLTVGFVVVLLHSWGKSQSEHFHIEI